MKLYKVFQITLVLSLTTASLASCHQQSSSSKAVETTSKAGTPQLTQPIFPLQDKPRPTFQSDEQLKTNFQQQKAELLTLMQKCKSEQESQLLKPDTFQSFSTCVVDEPQLKSVNLKEIAVEGRKRQPLPPGFQGYRVLFATDYYKNESGDTFFEEKGYVYSPTPLKQDVLQTGSLDQFASQYSIEKRKNETWKYIQIEPNWYLYYRQYYYPYLG